MATSKQYRFQAVECLQLAEQAHEFYVRAALLELAAEFQEMADFLDQQERAAERGQAAADALQRRRRSIG